jgi:hypothetical protein
MTYLIRLYWWFRRVHAAKNDQYISEYHLNEILREKGKS